MSIFHNHSLNFNLNHQHHPELKPDEPQDEITTSARRALDEDIGTGDITADLIADDSISIATVISRDQGILCGCAWFDAVFHQLDNTIEINWQVDDSNEISPDQNLCTLKGPSKVILTGERTALNFLQTLSGTATITRQYVNAVKGTGAVILDTRKTLPGLRLAQKYAVRCGGGTNHRMGLYDGILIKENHIHAAGSIEHAVEMARKKNAGMLANILMEVEVETLDQVKEALAAGADRLLLDNFDEAGIREAVAINNKKAKLEASGNVTLDNIHKLALTGVDYISVGALTKHVYAVDFSMRFE